MPRTDSPPLYRGHGFHTDRTTLNPLQILLGNDYTSTSPDIRIAQLSGADFTADRYAWLRPVGPLQLVMAAPQGWLRS